ncbi:EF-hand domain-containing protein [Streptomyces sp. NPDC047928]|uniref:EF-hand domain-containing protein n=1 Tax=unclassified Streptomyces TaxID=2593676 RepID=UPI00371AB3F0
MSLTAYQDKMAHRFDRFDRDGDGVVTETDFEELAHSILADFGQSPTTPKGRALLDGARRLWAGFAELADADGDGRITQEEFIRAATDHLRGDEKRFSRVVRPWAGAVIDVADTDDNGEVTVGEWERMLVAMRATPERARDKAAALDTDGDGRISLEEVMRSAVRLYATDEPLNMPQPTR